MMLLRGFGVLKINTSLVASKNNKTSQGVLPDDKTAKRIDVGGRLCVALNGGISYNAAMCSEHMVITRLSH
jgi:hypothetical protein